MKKVLKSLLMVAALALVVTTATKAYFSSTVTAEDNVIQTGTLMVAVDTAQNDTDGRIWNTDAWMVVRDMANGTVNVGNPFVDWTNAAPGDTHEYYVGIRNPGSLPFEFRFSQGTQSEWVSGPRFGQTLSDGTVCPAVEDAVDTLVTMTQVHQFASNNCEGEFGCHNLYYSLTGLGWVNQAGLSAGNATPDAGWYYGTVGAGGQSTGNHYALEANSFAVYRVQVTLDADGTDNCYQGATYHFDLTVDGKQVEDPRW